MEDLETKVKKLEDTNTILKCVLVFAFIAIVVCFVKNYKSQIRLKNTCIYFQDKLDGTYDDVQSGIGDTAFSGDGSDDLDAEINSYIKERDYYLKNK